MREVDGVRPETASSIQRDNSIEGGEQKALEDLLKRLPKAQAEVIALAYFDGMTHVETAEHLGLSEEWVKGRMRLGIVEHDQAGKDRDRIAQDRDERAEAHKNQRPATKGLQLATNEPRRASSTVRNVTLAP